MAPIVMYVQSRGVAEVLAGKDSGWESQRRDDGSLPLSGLLKSYGGLSLLRLARSACWRCCSPSLAAWMAPVTLGLVLAVPLVAADFGTRPRAMAAQGKLLSIPEETDPPPILKRATVAAPAAAFRGRRTRTDGRVPADQSQPADEKCVAANRPVTIAVCDGPIAQWLEQRTHNPLVPGSSPGGPTT